MKIKNKIITLIIFIIITVIAIQIHLEIHRGYGLMGGIGRSFPFPKYQASSGLSQISSAVEEAGFYDILPKIDDLMKNAKELTLNEDQPFEKYGIYILKWEGAYGRIYKYLYSSVYTLEEQSLIIEKGKISSIVYATSFGRWDETKRSYVSFPEYSKKIEKELSNHWQYAGVMINGELTGDIPPIPGCLVVADNSQGENAMMYYPKNILPAFEKIYPNIKIPDNRIIE